jgi:hypothetical protein
MIRSSSNLQGHSSSEELAKLTKIILNDPLLLRRLNDRVQELFLDDIRELRDRHYGGKL